MHIRRKCIGNLSHSVNRALGKKLKKSYPERRAQEQPLCSEPIKL